MKAVVKDAKAMLGEDLELTESEFPNGNAEDSANTNTETQPSKKRIVYHDIFVFFMVMSFIF